MPAKRACEHCGKPFIPQRTWQRFDRVECQRAAAQERLIERLREEVRKEYAAGGATE